MLSELQEIESQLEQSQGAVAAQNAVDDLRKTAFEILRRQFVWNGDYRSAHIYQTAMRQQHRRFLESLFEAFGFNLIVNTQEQWIGIVPEEGGPNPAANLKTDETIVLLLLAMVWRDGMENGLSDDRSVVSAASDEIFSRHMDILGKERMSRARFMDIIKEFKRRGLVNIGDEDPETLEVFVAIRPIIHVLVSINAVAALESFASKTEKDLQAIDRDIAIRQEAESVGEPDEERDAQPVGDDADV